MESGYNVRFINPVLEAVTNVLSQMAQIQVVMNKPYINHKRTATGDVTGLIGLTGSMHGVLSVTFDKELILQITNKMLDEHYTELDSNIADAVGEMTNMITGQARMHLSKDGISLKASTPSVVIGKGHIISHIVQAPILSIPFSTDFGSFVVEITLASSSTAKEDQPFKKTLWRRPSKHTEDPGTPPKDTSPESAP